MTKNKTIIEFYIKVNDTGNSCFNVGKGIPKSKVFKILEISHYKI